VSLVEVRNLEKHFHRRDGTTVRAVNDVSFDIAEGETLALIGESGSGKSTIGRMILRLIDHDAGTIIFDGRDISTMSEAAIRPLRASMQLVFQEPFESLNPRMRIGDIIAEPLIVHHPDVNRADREQRVLAALGEVNLPAQHAERLPSELSGGQQQRVGIARALITRPKFVVLDEPTSSLDLSVQAQILLLLKGIQEKTGISYLYISHDLSTVQYISDRTAVIQFGVIKEIGPTREVINNAQDDYTKKLIGSFLDPDIARGSIESQGSL